MDCAGFDDSAWKLGPAGFGTPQTPGAIVRTLWNTKDIWLRREFTLGLEKLVDPQLAAHCDEDGTVYINGVLAAELPGWTTRYEQFDLPAGSRRSVAPRQESIGGALPANYRRPVHRRWYCDSDADG